MVSASPIARGVLSAAAALLFAGAAPAQSGNHDNDDAPAAHRPPGEGAQLPAQELSESILYEYLVGEVAAQRGSPALAAQMFVDLARRTRDPRIARRAVEFAGTAREPKFAIEAAKIWHDVDPASARALRALVSLLLGAQRVEEAEPYLAKVISADAAGAAGAFMQLNRLFAANPDKAANLRAVRRLAEPYPDLPQAHFAVAQAALTAEDEPGALAAIRHAARLAPDWPLAPLFEAQILQRRAPGEAADRLAGYLSAHPADREVRLAYARTLVGGKRYAEARAQFELLLRTQPDNADALYAVGLLAQQMREYAVAEASLRRVLELGFRDRNAVRFALGQIAEEQKQWEGATEWYRAIEPGEHYLPARFRVAQMLAKQGRIEEARRALRAADGEREPLRIQLLIAEAQLLREANRASEAFELLGAALAKEPDHPELLYDFALTAERIERFDILEEKLRRLIQLRPDHAHAYNALGYSFAERNLRLGEARKLIEKALELAPQDSFIVDSMGWVLFRQGDLKGALGWLRRAYGERPDAEIGAHLGEVLWATGAREEARRIWDEALRSHPENDALQKTIKRFGP